MDSGYFGLFLLLFFDSLCSGCPPLHARSLKYVADETCITYEAVDAAFSAAKSKLRLPSTKSKTLTERDIDQLGKVIVETTRILANQ
jgi:hypothetical protein